MTSSLAITSLLPAWRGTRKSLRFGLQIAAVCAAGSALARAVAASGLIVPASGLGIAVLFALFASRLVRPEWLEPGAPWLARHLGVFFVPILAYAALTWRLPVRLLFPVAVTLVISASAGFVTTALIFERAVREDAR